MTSALTHQCHVDGELHTYANRSDEDDDRHSAELDADQSHHAEQLHRHQRQHQHLLERTGKHKSINLVLS